MRLSPAVAERVGPAPLVVFDGHCLMCTTGAQFILRHDPRGTVRLTTAQSEIGQAIYRDLGLVLDETMLLVEKGEARTKSEAALAIARHLGWPLKALAVFGLVPKGLRDPLYDVVARNRQRWFGRREACWMPTPDQRARIL